MSRIADWIIGHVTLRCPRGWVPWQKFTAANDRGAVGAGCGDAVTVPKPLAKEAFRD